MFNYSKIFFLLLFVLTISGAACAQVRVDTPVITNFYSISPDFVRSYIESSLYQCGWQISQNQNALVVKTDIWTDIGQENRGSSTNFLGWGTGGSRATYNIMGSIVMKVYNPQTGATSPIVNYTGNLNPSVMTSGNISTPYGSTSSWGDSGSSQYLLARAYVQCLVNNAVSLLNARKNELPAQTITPNNSFGQNSSNTFICPVKSLMEVVIYAPPRSNVYFQVNYNGFEKLNSGNTGVIRKNVPYETLITVKCKGKTRIGNPPCEIDIR